MSVVLSEHLPLLASAQDGIQKLRGLILELAVRGKLAPQDPKDEPASELLKRIAKERARLEAEGSCKKSKAMPVVSADEQPFALPNGWSWIRNGNLFSLRKGKVPKNLSETKTDIPYLDIEALDRGNVRRYTADLSAPSSKDTDILVVCDGSRSGLVLNGKNGAVGSTLAVVESPRFIQPFIKLIFRQCFDRLNSTMKGAAIPHLDTAKLVLDVVGLPPLAEQHRIVAKVDELMALCDRLEAEVGAGETAHAKLVETLLGTLTQSNDDAELAANWQRLAEHFDTLFTTESSLDALKQTVLQLAVIGKLVPQDPNDEPVFHLCRYLKGFASGTAKFEDSSVETDLPFSAPVNWKITRLSNVTKVISGNAFKSEDFKTEGTVRAIKIANVGVGEFFETDDFLPDGFDKEFQKYSVNWGDILIALTRPYISNGLKVCICPNSYDASLLNQRVGAIKTDKSQDISAFIYLYLSSVFSLEYVVNKSRALNQPNLNIPDLRNLPLPLPPLAEQHRIVAKVDELMALCDRLKAGIAESRTRQARLSATLIESALQAA